MGWKEACAMLAPPLPTLFNERGPPPPPPLGYRPNIALFSRIDTCRGFSYTVFRDCVYIHAHTHTRHTPDAVRFFLAPTAPLTLSSLRVCVRACTAYIPRPDGVGYLYDVVGAVRVCVGCDRRPRNTCGCMRGSRSARVGGCRWEGVGKFKT